MLQDLNRCNAMRGLQLLRGLRKPTAAPSLSGSQSKRRLKDGRDWWGDEKSTEAGGWGVTQVVECTILMRVWSFVSFLRSLCTRGTVTQSLWLPIDGAQLILKNTGLSQGCPSQKCHRLHGGGDELRRKASLPVLEPGDGGKKRVDSACMYAVAGSHKSWPSSIYTGSILMVSYLLHSLSPSYIV